jgi:hypothetical protein
MPGTQRNIDLLQAEGFIEDRLPDQPLQVLGVPNPGTLPRICLGKSILNTSGTRLRAERTRRAQPIRGGARR